MFAHWLSDDPSLTGQWQTLGFRTGDRILPGSPGDLVLSLEWVITGGRREGVHQLPWSLGESRVAPSCVLKLEAGPSAAAYKVCSQATFRERREKGILGCSFVLSTGGHSQGEWSWAGKSCLFVCYSCWPSELAVLGPMA